MNNRRFASASFVLGTIILAMTGCGGGGAQPVSMNHWQSGVQKYVVEQGNGDMNALREVEVAPDRPGFRIFSRDRTEDSEDIAGVLVGAHEFGGRLWYLYLVAQTEEQVVQEIHPAALAQDGPQFLWRSGAADAAALAKYRQGRAQAPGGPFQFPSPVDVFEWQGQGDMVTLREKTSGAEWTLDLARDARGQ
jgi:hypothetical protein